jgi:hypothetical protein
MSPVHNMEMIWFILGLIVTAAVVVFFMRRAMKARKLSGTSLKRVRQAWSHVESLQDPVRKVLEADKVLDLALGELGYTGSVADKLKKAGPRIKNLQAVWDAHKLRNHLAHETQATVTPQQAESALRALQAAVESFA